MTVVISLRVVAEELDALMEGFGAYLNRETGEVSVISIDDIRQLDGVDDLSEFDLPAWHIENLAHALEVLESYDWVRLPSTIDIHEWSIMEDFSISQDDSALRDELLGAIRGPGAFRLFKDIIHRRGIRDHWHEFKLKALEQLAADCLESHGIHYSRGESSPSAPAPN